MARPRMWIFDLDDTLYAEWSYVMSALQFAGQMVSDLYAVADGARFLTEAYENGVADPVQSLWQAQDLPQSAKAAVVAAMRAHRPAISLFPGAGAVLDSQRAKAAGFGIMTDGRSVTQRAKLAALGCLDARAILISEESGWHKPDPQCYEFFHTRFPDVDFGYVGDNPTKDFVGARAAGWDTVMLVDQGSNVHRHAEERPAQFHAAHVAGSWQKIGEFLNELS